MENKENYGIRGLTTAGVIIILVILGGLIVAGITAQKRAKAPIADKAVTNFEECRQAVLELGVESGYHINQTLPPTCETPDGQIFIDESTIPAPVFELNDAANISTSGATLQANILGLMDPVYGTGQGQNAYFEYGTSASNLNQSTTGAGPVQGTLSENVTGLQSGTTYYFRAVIDYGPNAVGQRYEYSDIKSFKTKIASQTQIPPLPPASITVTAPNGREVWQAGQTYTVSWNVQNAPANGLIGLSVHGDINADTGFAGIYYFLPASSNSYNWTIPTSIASGGTGFCADDICFPEALTGTNLKVRARLYDATGIANPCVGFCEPGTIPTLVASDESDNTFIINP